MIRWRRRLHLILHWSIVFDLALRAETNTGDFNGVRGRTTGDPVGLVNHSMPHVHVALGVDSGRFLDEFVERMAEVCR